MTASNNTIVSGPIGQPLITGYTAAQLSALAAAGGLTPNATYITSDTGVEYRAINASTLETINNASYPVIYSPFEGSSSYGTSKGAIHARDTSLVPSGYDLNGFASFQGNGEQWNNLPLAATVSITGSISGTVLTVSAVGVATNLNGSHPTAEVKRGHFITGHVGIPAGTYIIYDPADTGAGSTGTYSLSANCGTIGSTTFSLTCKDGVGGCLARTDDIYSGPYTSEDTDAQKVWMLTIDPTHRVTSGHGRAVLQSSALELRKRYLVEAQVRFYDQGNGSWQTSNSTTVEPSIAIMMLEQLNGGGDYDGDQDVTNGPFSIFYTPGGTLNFLVRSVNENYGVLQGDGFWNWADGDRMAYFANRTVKRQIKGTNPVVLKIEFFLDERMVSEGGEGWLKAWFNNELVIDHQGPTSYPVGRVTGEVGQMTFRLGMYDYTYGVVADNTLCSAARSTALQRNLAIKYASIKVKE